VASTRRLAAIMFTDMVGYTASTQADEGGTLDLLRQQAELVRPLLAVHQGRVIKSTGDGFLVEFDSALKATQCAVSIQRRIYERNSEGGLAPIHIRIGIHLGDVVQSGTDILGDAVNIAARIEPMAEPGGICVSGAVHEQVRNKIPDKLEKLRPTQLKGLEHPVEIYKVALPWLVREPSAAPSGPTGIAVLPFSNISPDPKDEYFADGLTEELITVLSQLRQLPVIARTSVMQYRSTAKPVSQIGVELGVSTILEGSVRKAGNRLRITAQLIDTASQRHLWANSYDRELDDVFAVQTEIAKQVAEVLKIGLRSTEAARLESRHTVRADSYLAYLKGRTLLYGRTEGPLRSAKEQFELAVSLDDKNAAAYAGLAESTRLLGIYLGTPRATWEETRRRLVARAIELDPNIAEAHLSLGTILWDDYDHDGAEREYKIALSLNPSYSMAHFQYALWFELEGQAEGALQELALAEVTDPRWPVILAHMAQLLSWLGRSDEALAKIQKYREVAQSGADHPSLLAFYFLDRSDPEACLKELRRAEELQQEPAWKWLTHAWFLAISGRKDEARAFVRSHQDSPEPPRFGWFAEAVAEVYAELGELDDCFRWLEKAIETHAVSLGAIRLNPRYDSVRRDPRFQTLLKKVNLG
jgi:adenylate cyclase